MTRRNFLILAALLVSPGSCPLPAQTGAQPVRASHGMVVSSEPLASRAGLQILRAGGTALDAALAVGFCLAVTWPAAGNLGGGGFMVLHLADGREAAVDFREMAPAAARRDMYLGASGRVVPERSRLGLLAAGIPGTVAGLCHVQKSYGHLSLAQVMAPAIHFAQEGFPLSRFQAGSLNRARRKLSAFAESRRVFVPKTGPWKVGDILRQPQLAATLKRIAQGGADGFYKGPTADLLVAEMARGGGLITRADLANYQVKERKPIRGTYRGLELVSMPPPSSGGVALIQMLNLIEGFPMVRLGPGSERTLHILAESMRWAFRDRARYMGDPDFTKLPTRRLTSRSYADAVRPRLGRLAAVSRGLPQVQVPAAEKEQTTHFSVMDDEGNAVACTYTLNGGYGCGVTVTGAGFLLNNEMDDFSAAPGQPNMYGLIQGEANAVGPGKRPLSSMTPTLVKQDGHVVMVIGSPGGPTIINTVLQCILNVVDHKMNVAQAVALPRIHHQWLPDRLYHEPFGLNPDVARGLEARGHHLRSRGYMGDANGITWNLEHKILQGAADPRGGGLAAGY